MPPNGIPPARVLCGPAVSSAARDGQVIQEDIPVSSAWRIASGAKDVPCLSGVAPPRVSWIRSAPRPKTLRPDCDAAHKGAALVQKPARLHTLRMLTALRTYWDAN